MQCSVHQPSRYICQHGQRLLPDWSAPVRSVLVVLQHAGCELLERTATSETQKVQLRQQFLAVGAAIAQRLHQLGYCADLFDPRTGYPLQSQPGSLGLDDVAVARACLGYPVIHSHGCSILLHPTWNSAVYPSVLLSSAEPELLNRVTRDVLGGWLESGVDDFSRSAYHQSRRGEGSLIQ